MSVTPSGMLIELRDVQDRKALASMFLTLSGMLTEVRDVQLQKAEGTDVCDVIADEDGGEGCTVVESEIVDVHYAVADGCGK